MAAFAHLLLRNCSENTYRNFLKRLTVFVEGFRQQDKVVESASDFDSAYEGLIVWDAAYSVPPKECLKLIDAYAGKPRVIAAKKYAESSHCRELSPSQMKLRRFVCSLPGAGQFFDAGELPVVLIPKKTAKEFLRSFDLKKPLLLKRFGDTEECGVMWAGKIRD